MVLLFTLESCEERVNPSNAQRLVPVKEQIRSVLTDKLGGTAFLTPYFYRAFYFFGGHYARD